MHTYQSSFNNLNGEGNYRHDDNRTSIVVVLINKPEDTAEDLEHVKRIQDLKTKEIQINLSMVALMWTFKFIPYLNRRRKLNMITLAIFCKNRLNLST